jgi:23S rRNA (cytosine1962-C5)-methyltransferase
MVMLRLSRMPTPPDTSPGTRLRLRLSPAAEKAIRAGHPWVFSDSVRDQNREGGAGELAVIYSRSDKFLAVGLYDPASPLRVRILQSEKPATIDAEWWRGRLAQALAAREGMFGPDINGYRLINGESDGWPGMVLDRYAETLVLKLYSAIWLPRLQEIQNLIISALSPQALVLRLSRNITEAAKRDFNLQEGVIHGTCESTVVFVENGLKFESEVLNGQKTGFFLDQRENRERVGRLASGAEVLNAFSFSGGFSLYAARGGAKRVTDLDISPHALTSGDRNFALNLDLPPVRACIRATVQADAFTWLADGPRAQFDLIVVDPPSLARREAERAGAIDAYERLTVSALRRVRRGGILVAASCSAHVSADEFFAAVDRAALPWNTRKLWTSAHAPDHAVTFREAAYLKCVALRCS